jgi:hypothetical protein
VSQRALQVLEMFRHLILADPDARRELSGRERSGSLGRGPSCFMMSSPSEAPASPCARVGDLVGEHDDLAHVHGPASEKTPMKSVDPGVRG